jgi:transcriptional regulator with XRE-family HTH domain
LAKNADCTALFATQSPGNIHCNPTRAGRNLSGHFPGDLHKLLFLTKHPFHMAHTTSNPKIHEGRNLKRFRELFNYKQEALAFELGQDWNQQKISLLEQRETIENDILEQVAAVLKIPAEAIRNFDENQAINIITNTYHDFKDSAFVNNGNTPTFNVNPIEEIRKLHEEKMALYERMLREKDEMMGRLERLIGK